MYKAINCNNKFDFFISEIKTDCFIHVQKTATESFY